MAKKRQKNRPTHVQKSLSLDKANKLFTHGHFEAALPMYRELLKQQPKNPDILYSTGFTYYACKQYNEAAEALQKLLTLMPNHEKGRRMLLASLNDGKMTDAMLNMAKDIKDTPLNEGEYLQAFSAFLSVCDWDNALPMFNRCVNNIINGRIPAALLPGFLMDILGLNGISCETMHALTKQAATLSAQNIKSLPIKKEQLCINNKIKLAYLSTDFRAHPVGYFIYSILAAHNKCHFEVFCYSGSTIQDSVTKLMKDEANHFIDVSNLNEEEIAHRIYNDGIHVLVELGGYTESSNLKTVAYRPAPVSIAYLGYANSTGYSSMDFRITDPYVDTSDGTIYSETLLTLPSSFLCFGMRPTCERNQQAPVDKNGFITFGSFNHNRKLNPKVIETWSKILNSVNNSRLMLKGNWRSGILSDNILKEFKSHGINPEQIIFLPHTVTYDDHVACYNEIDIALDTFPYSGTTTTCEALWMGVPVITLVGNSHQSRVSYSILKNIGFEETIAHSEDEYITKAVNLANNPKGVTLLRTMLHTLFKYSPVARADSFVPDLEKSYINAWETKTGQTISFKHKDHNGKNQLTAFKINENNSNPYFTLSDCVPIAPNPTRRIQTALLCDRISPSLWFVIQSHCESWESDKTSQPLTLIIPKTKQHAQVSNYFQSHFIQPYKGDKNPIQLRIATQKDKSSIDTFMKTLSDFYPHIQTVDPECNNNLKEIIDPYAFLHPLTPLIDNKITIFIPTYNRCNLLQRAVKSILAQTYTNFELLIMDNASSDGTEEYCRQLASSDKRICYHRNQKNLGLFDNYVLAYSLIKTDLYACCPDDDFLFPGHFEHTVNFFSLHPELGMVFGQTFIGDVSGNTESPAIIPNNYMENSIVNPRQMMLDSISGNQMCLSSILVRKPAVERMLTYAEKHLNMSRQQVIIGEGDYFFNLLMLACAPIGYVHTPCSYYSVHSSNHNDYNSYSAALLGGGWSLEIRLRTVRHLQQIYNQCFGEDIYMRRRLQLMGEEFRSFIQQTESAMTNEEKFTCRDKLLEFKLIISKIEGHANIEESA